LYRRTSLLSKRLLPRPLKVSFLGNVVGNPSVEEGHVFRIILYSVYGLNVAEFGLLIPLFLSAVVVISNVTCKIILTNN